MSIEIYNALLLAVREEVCLELSLGGFGELDSMLKALNMVDRDCEVELVKKGVGLEVLVGQLLLV